LFIDFETKLSKKKVKISDFPLSTFAYNRECKIIVIGDIAGDFYVVSEEGELLSKAQHKFSSDITCICFSKDSLYFYISSRDGSIKSFSSKTYHTVRSYSTNFGPIVSISVSPIKNEIVIASADKVVRVLDSISLKPLIEIGPFQNQISCISWHPSGEYLFIGSIRGCVSAYNMSTGKKTIDFKEQKSSISSFDVNSNGPFLLSTSLDSFIALYDIEDCVLIQKICYSKKPVVSAKWSSDGKYIVTTDNDGLLTVFSFEIKENDVYEYDQFEDEEEDISQVNIKYNNQLSGISFQKYKNEGCNSFSNTIPVNPSAQYPQNESYSYAQQNQYYYPNYQYYGYNNNYPMSYYYPYPYMYYPYSNNFNIPDNNDDYSYAENDSEIPEVYPEKPIKKSKKSIQEKKPKKNKNGKKFHCKCSRSHKDQEFPPDWQDESNSFQEEESIVFQEEESIVFQEEESVVIQEEESVVIQEEESVVIQEEESVVFQEEESVVFQEEESVDIKESNDIHHPEDHQENQNQEPKINESNKKRRI